MFLRTSFIADKHGWHERLGYCLLKIQNINLCMCVHVAIIYFSKHDYF